ncbi:hypothetical protein HC081234_02920 [Helicobacter cinaedi]|nr:hypothetical protein HC081234_02920 [Helicobacter cinaedi]
MDLGLYYHIKIRLQYVMYKILQKNLQSVTFLHKNKNTICSLIFTQMRDCI